MLDHFIYIRNQSESLRDWERSEGLASDLLLLRIQINWREGENQAREDTSNRPVARKDRLPELHKSACPRMLAKAQTEVKKNA